MEKTYSLDNVTADAFTTHVNTTFVLTLDDGRETPLTLANVNPGPTNSAGNRQPFSLLFTAPPGEVLPQRIYSLHHPAFGVLEIFIVPIAATAEHTDYEAIFN